MTYPSDFRTTWCTENRCVDAWQK